MNEPQVQHKATISVKGRKVDIHAPPFTSVKLLEEWLAQALANPDVELISKTWQ